MGEPEPHLPGADRYTPVVEIAHGGMGRVYLVKDAHLDRSVVMKILRENRQDPESRRRFLNEAQVTARLEHPNIVPVYDQAVDADGTPYFTMKMVRGVDLAEIVSARRRGEVEYSLIRILQVFQSVCDAVGYAHVQGILHRDLKPENVMHGDYGEVFVMDWGLAKRATDRRPDAGSGAGLPLQGSGTLDGTVVGTPAYMSPEQARGEPLTTRSDLYSLGAILYEILTRRPPYEADSPQEILELVKFASPKAPREIDPSIPAPLEAICLKAMARNPKARYETAAEVGEDVQRFIEGQAVQAEALSWWGLLGRRLHRHLLGVWITLACLLAVGALAYLASLSRERGRSDAHLQVATDRALRETRERHRREEMAMRRARPLLEEACAIAALDPEAALARVAEAERCLPAWPEAELARARILLDANRPAEARPLLDGRLERTPDDPEALRLRARMLQALGEDAEAAKDLARARQLQPTLTEQAWSDAEAAVTRGTPAEAVEVFDRGLRISPKDPRGLLGKGRALLAAGRASEAAAPLAEALEAGASPADALPLLASARARAGDFPGALDACGRLLDASLPEAARGVLMELARSAPPADLGPALGGFLDRHPAEAGMAVPLAQILAGREAWAPAADLLGRELKRNPDRQDLLYFHARLLSRAGRPAEALAGLGRLAALLPRDPEVHFLKAEAYLALRRPKEAAAALDACEGLLTAPSAHTLQAVQDLRLRIRDAGK